MFKRTMFHVVFLSVRETGTVISFEIIFPVSPLKNVLWVLSEMNN